MQLKIINGYAGYLGETVLENVNFEINGNDKVAVVGRNGSGKSTLLKLISGELELMTECSTQPMYVVRSNGLSIGVLKQLAFEDDNLTLLQEILKVYKPVIDLQAQIDTLQKELENSPTDDNVKRFAKLNDRFKDMDGYFYKKEYQTALKKFGFTDADYDKKLSEFSGGQRTRIAFIIQLLTKPDLLLLDEPTNHLDMEAVEWLEGYLKAYKKAMVLVSHDREFLDNVANVVCEVEHKKLTRYVGNYTRYTELKQARFAQEKKAYAEQQAEIERLDALVERFRYKATKAKMVQSKIKQIERIDVLEDPEKADTRTFRGTFEPRSESGNDVLFCKDLVIGYDAPLATVNLDIKKGDKLGIIGANGIGKSTFMRTVVGLTPKISGLCKQGIGVDVGYFDQQIASKPTGDTLLDSFWADYPSLTSGEVRSELAKFLFCGDDVFKKVCELSGGERVRLALCKLFKTRPNLLILDEPTNHMDILSKEALEGMLSDYSGTLIFVSHDRYFVKKIADKLLVFEDGKATYYPYPYADYLIEKERAKQDKPRTLNDAISAAAPVNMSAAKLSYEQGKERQRAERRILTLDGKISNLEAKVNELTAAYNSDENMSDYLKLEKLQAEINGVEDEILSLLEEREKLQNFLSTLPS